MVRKLILMFLLFISYTMYSQEVNNFEYKNAFKISPIEFGNAEFQITYERYLGNRSSSILIIPSIILKDNQDESKSGAQIMGQYRIFLSHLNESNNKSILGIYNIAFFGGVYALYLNSEEDYRYFVFNSETNMGENKDFHKDIQSIEGGAIFGMQADITSRIVLDFYVGGGIRKTDLTDTRDNSSEPDNYFYYDVFDPEYTGVKPRLGLQLGFTF